MPETKVNSASTKKNKDTSDAKPAVGEAQVDQETSETKTKSTVRVDKGATQAQTTKLKKLKKTVEHVHIKIKATFNNTHVTATDPQGNVIARSSSGKAGYKNSRKSTPFSAASAAEQVVNKLKEFGAKTAEIFVKGPGTGFESSAKVIGANFSVTAIHEISPIPHNGCRPSKRRRV